MNTREIEAALKAKFPPEQILWRVAQAGIGNGGKPWAKVLAYVDARAVQERLDLIFGALGWEDDYEATTGGILCRLTVRIPGGGSDFTSTITKCNGSPETDIEAFKGGISKALVRVAASGYGIGRYLYNLTETWAECSDTKQSGPGWHYARHKGSAYWWKTPEMPPWANAKLEDMEALAACGDAIGVAPVATEDPEAIGDDEHTTHRVEGTVRVSVADRKEIGDAAAEAGVPIARLKELIAEPPYSVLEPSELLLCHKGTLLDWIASQAKQEG